MLLNAEDKRGFHTVRVSDELDEKANKCGAVYPVNIIKIHYKGKKKPRGLKSWLYNNGNKVSNVYSK